MAAAGVPVDPELVRVGGYRPETRQRAGPRAALAPGPPDRRLRRQRHLRDPHHRGGPASSGCGCREDVSVVGFDNVPESALCTPSLTTIAQPLHDIGATALRMLVELLAGREPTPAHVCLPTHLVVRDSTGPLPASSAP